MQGVKLFQKEREEVEIMPQMAQQDQLKELILQNITPDVMEQVAVNLSKNINEDYTSQTIETRNIDEMSPIITTLTDVVKQDEDGNIDILTDELGLWLEMIGAKGIIPPSAMPYNQRANFSSIYTRLHNGVYRVIYDTDEQGNVRRDSKGEPVIIKKEPVHLGVTWRNLNQLCNLAYMGSSRNLQGKIFVGTKGTSPIGMDNRWDDVLTNLFGGSK